MMLLCFSWKSKIARSAPVCSLRHPKVPWCTVWEPLHWANCFTFIPSLNSPDNPDRYVLWSPFYRCKYWDAGYLNDLSKSDSGWWRSQHWNTDLMDPQGHHIQLYRLNTAQFWRVSQTTVLVLWILKLTGGAGFSTKPPHWAAFCFAFYAHLGPHPFPSKFRWGGQAKELQKLHLTLGDQVAKWVTPISMNCIKTSGIWTISRLGREKDLQV